MDHPSGANNFAMEGCSPTDVFDWTALFWYQGIMMSFYGVVMFLSPFKLFPSDGIYKFGWLTWHAGVKDVEGNGRGEYDDGWVGGLQHMTGVQFLFLGMISIWASGNHEDFTFFVAVVISYVLAFLTFVKILLQHREKYNNMVYTWGVMFLICLILSIVVLTSEETDAEQLSNVVSDGPAGGVLWFFAVFSLLGAVNQGLCSFDKFASMGAAMYMKEPYASTRFGNGVQRMNAWAGLSVGAVFLWAAIIHGKDFAAGDEVNFQFPIVMIIMYALMIVTAIVENVVFPGHMEEFANLQMGVLAGSGLAAFVIGWQVTCNV